MGEGHWVTPPVAAASFRPSHTHRAKADSVRVCKTGGHVAVYHVRQPKRPAGTRLVHRIVVLTRTNHAPRVCFVFEKLAGELVLEVAA